MNNQYFIIDEEKYVIIYTDKKANIYKDNNGIKELNFDEEKRINNKLNVKYSYIYDSMVGNIVYKNDGIDRKDYVINIAAWLEKIIPSDCRSNLYRNIQTLRTILNININLSKNDTYSTGSETVAGYNTSNNMLIIGEKSLQELWQAAQSYPNPQEFYYRHYAQTLLHELVHMASSNYNSVSGVSLCGFDKYPTNNENEKNRGLTEGFTEIISMAGLSNTTEYSSKYYMEVCLINQLFFIIGHNTFLRAYFSNQGICPMQDELYDLIKDPNKCYELFRNIELNYNIRGLCSEQNILGNIQDSLLDYLEKKLEIMSKENSIEEISEVLKNYEIMMITPEKLKMMNENPQNYYGIAENIIRYEAIKTRCLLNLKDNRKK